MAGDHRDRPRPGGDQAWRSAKGANFRRRLPAVDSANDRGYFALARKEAVLGGGLLRIVGLGHGSFAAACITLAGCAATNPTTGEFVYNAFFSPAQHLSDTLDAGDLATASNIYEDQAPFFDAAPDKHQDVIQRLASAITAEVLPELSSAVRMVETVDWPAEPDAWPSVRQALESATAAIALAEEHDILLAAQYRLPAYDSLLRQHDALKKEIDESAWAAFANFPLADGPNFFAAYPVTLSAAQFHAEHPEAHEIYVAQPNADALAQVFQEYRFALPARTTNEMGLRFYEARLNEAGAADSRELAAILEAVFATNAAGLPLETIPGARVAMIDVTSRSLVADKQLQFAVGIDVDLPVDTATAELQDAFARPAVMAADILIIVDVRAARVDRKITRTDTVSSEFQTGARQVANPEYRLAENELDVATINYQQARAALSNCVGCGLIPVLILRGAITEAEGVLQAAREKVSGTPQTLTEPVYQNYSYSRMSLEVSKEADVKYYVVDRLAGVLVEDSFELRETRSFTVSYDLHEADRTRSQQLVNLDSEDAVLAFEDSGVEVGLSAILKQFLESPMERQPVPAVADLRERILDEKNAVLAALEARRFGIEANDDARMESVVVVYHPSGGIGTGFYVRDDVILTNFHVIDGTQFVEMKLYSGQETFGRVIAQDVRLDLAIIQVQARGQPVEFYKDLNVPLGATVEAMGHPTGLEFSVTRGVVSAMREIRSTFMPGGRPVRFFQTDTAINPGNSGGPLFLSGLVVGVNTQKLAATEIEGLSFAVHYAEVTEFLHQNGIETR
ncbi:MAG: trypsin-like peptidase domain-containing protein [Proteobacteria bacterium]|nr:trypsin-like peptidase domain-containing protein [Pseudomonadota bacterium]